MYSYKLHRVGSLAFESNYLYCEDRIAFIDHYFERAIARGKDVDIDTFIEFIKRQYVAKYGEDAYYSQLEQTIARKFWRRKKREPDIKDSCFQWYFKDSKNQFNVGNKKGRDEQFDYIKDGMIENFGAEAVTDEYIIKNIKREVNNHCNRLRRAKRKGELNFFNYFVTFTYDDELHTAESFKRKLHIKLKNEAYRRGWAYMIIKEEGEKTKRIHYHALMYIPKEGMIGELFWNNRPTEKSNAKGEKYWVTEKQLENTWFNANFGMTNFQEITYVQGTMLPLDYIQKYMNKTEERIKYSRHIPSYEIKELPDDRVKIEMTYPDNKTVRGFIVSDFYLPKNIPGRKAFHIPDFANTG